MAEIQEIENPKKIQKKSQGKRKIPIAPIQKKTSRQVTFSKRRVGLFKKAGELCSLCGAEVAVIAFSGAGKLFSFGHPSADSVILRYLDSSSDRTEVISPIPEKKLSEFWWNEPIGEGLGLDELEGLRNAIEGLRNRVFSRLNEINSSTSLVNYDNYNGNYYNYSNNYNYNINNEQSVDFGSMDNNWNNNYPSEVANYECNPMSNVASSSSWYGVG